MTVWTVLNIGRGPFLARVLFRARAPPPNFFYGMGPKCWSFLFEVLRWWNLVCRYSKWPGVWLSGATVCSPAVGGFRFSRHRRAVCPGAKRLCYCPPQGRQVLIRPKAEWFARHRRAFCRVRSALSQARNAFNYCSSRDLAPRRSKAGGVAAGATRRSR